MKPILILLALVLFTSLSAQDTIGKKSRIKIVYSPRTQAKDSVIPAGPNEISLNIAPIFSALLGSFPDNEARFSLFYKRTLKKPRLVFRSGILFKPQVENYFFRSDDDWYFDITDSSRTLNDFQKSQLIKWQLNSGMEWRSKGNKRWSTYVGLDLIGGISGRNYSLVDIHQRLDSSGNWVADNTKTNWIELLDYKKSHNWYAGISPAVGLRYAFTKHWLIYIESSFEAFIFRGESYKRNSFGTSLVRQEEHYFEFNLNSLLSEFAIVYRF